MKKTVMTVIRVIVIVGVLGLLTYGGFLGMNRVSGNGDYTIDVQGKQHPKVTAEPKQ